MLETDCAGHRLVLLPDKAACLPEAQTLLVADAHIGKAVSFRRWGVPVPQGTTSDTLARLTRAVEATGARRVVFLGDFLHSPRSHAGATLAALHRWREHHAGLELVLVRGNHDRRAGDPPAGLGIASVAQPWILGGLALCHEPQAVPGHYALAGHLHPCIRLDGPARDRLRLPCFWLGREVGVLPAFGSFTGMHPVQPAEGDRVYAVTDHAVVPVPDR
ncbi:ligase-associated DNA damage response endonuclease PdeM [Caldimonas thermodepolymerans]|jgi:Predicted ICC-like phosphoesterases|uniref:DEAD/DEAH box helicase n=1 Tax=Caldimonas thermodepolymerans TaxID=215580 RepID=A0A2S5T1W1_9BURK|nr:ligase-associated DNA damage response endonuclease PdeM [Caldimonas thermodepolymerans]PPE69005.1 DEAD/DEAH box helicase [Caldimonas thermodepolymerans]QPC32305.1 ligase-associated DNA damage response endonuclease PdeM [Caldimonas thermodepolymerans]RDH98201.1 putative phosphoesterase [Caldimonas thermodepolymerans]TCP08022.1 putative phosphoesterase [Caldimonas thermodepolymerans]UZG45105.1 ligase-associated DNA damage response endonuclease PdeM [Caldimonas thermodepolymerans]